MLPKQGLFLLLHHQAHNLAQENKVGEWAVIGPNTMGRLLREEVEVPVRQGLQAVSPHVAVDNLPYDAEAVVVHFPEHRVLQPVPSRRCVAGALKDAVQTRGCRRRQAQWVRRCDPPRDVPNVRRRQLP